MKYAELPYLVSYRASYMGKREAVYEVSTGKHYTYGDLARRVDKLAYFLMKVWDLKKGDRIGFISTNTIALVDAYYLTSKTGIILTTYNGLLAISDTEHLIKNESPSVIFYSWQFREKVRELKEVFSDIKFVCVNGEAGDNEPYSYADIMEMDYEEFETELPDLDDTQMLVHTGGTTGTPKAAKLTFRSLLYNHVADVIDLELRSGDVGLLMLPLYHTASWNVIFLPLLMIGAKIIMMETFDAPLALKLIQEERPTVTIGVSTIYLNMSKEPNFKDVDFSSFRFMISGAAPITKDILEIYWNRNVKLVNGYGMTEIGPNNLVPPVHGMTIDQIREKWASAGRVMSFNTVRVVNDEVKDLPAGEPGELLWKGNLCFHGYWNAPEETENIVTDGWVSSGDIGYYDEDGFYYICDRSKNIFISGGENIYPTEIEAVMRMHPAIKDCCIFGVPDEVWHEVGKALIVVEDGCAISKDEINEYCVKNLPTIKRPKYIQFVDSIPVNAVGKRNISHIRKLFGNIDAE